MSVAAAVCTLYLMNGFVRWVVVQVDSSEGGPISYLPDNLDRWESFAGKGGKDVRIFPVPPPPVAIPVRPFMLDSAQSYIEMPSLQHRIQKKADQKTSLARFFSWRS